MLTPLLTFAVVRSISVPFNNGTQVELKLSFDQMHGHEGEILWRMPASRAQFFAPGDTFSVSLRRVGE